MESVMKSWMQSCSGSLLEELPMRIQSLLHHQREEPLPKPQKKTFLATALWCAQHGHGVGKFCFFKFESNRLKFNDVQPNGSRKIRIVREEDKKNMISRKKRNDDMVQTANRGTRTYLEWRGEAMLHAQLAIRSKSKRLSRSKESSSRHPRKGKWIAKSGWKKKKRQGQPEQMARIETESPWRSLLHSLPSRPHIHGPCFRSNKLISPSPTFSDKTRQRNKKTSQAHQKNPPGTE
jgi:hypothetical protein